MSRPHRLCLVLVFFLPSLICAQQVSAQGGAVTNSPDQRLSPVSNAVQGLINLDVVVTDKSGKPISGLGPKDFTLLDNGQPEKILSFHAYDGISAGPDPPVEVILLVDTLQMPTDLAFFEREEVERFLRQNGGHLAQPVSIFGLSDIGVWTLAQASIDGNALAAEIAKNKLVFIRQAVAGPKAEPFELLNLGDPAGLSGLKALGDIATAARRKSGRKLLVWVGPGWNLGSGRGFQNQGSEKGEDFESIRPGQATFDTIYWFSTLLREARISLYNFSVGENDPIRDPAAFFYLNFLNGAESVQQASIKYVDRKVLAVGSGGRVLDPNNDLVSQIDDCVHEGSVYYTLSFDPPHSEHPGEYHNLRVQVADPDLTVRTSTGYYDQPFYSDQPNPAARRVTVQQLEQVLGTARSTPEAEVERQLSDLELTERLSGAELSSWAARLRGKRARRMLVALADASAFLNPPPTEIPAGGSPDLTAQRRMVSLVVDYLNKTIPNLPNFYATRTTLRYEETPQFNAGNARPDYRPLHVVGNSKATVLYQNSKEVVDSGMAKRQKLKAKDGYLITYGTFGPLLGAVTDAIASGLTWSYWEQAAGGRNAVFHYKTPAQESHYLVDGCCLPDGDGTNAFQEVAGYHGEIAIDPASGAILRLELVADLESTTPLVRSDIMLEYGPVEIGGKTYICPVRSVSISRARSVTLLTEWDESFRTFGSYATMLNDVTFDDYHLFRVSSRILSGGPQ
ncbi:MAG TPA: VWA domain-containing protein [Candidatus Acidoferrum sp.]